MTRSATALLTLLALLAALLSIMTWAARRTHNAADFAIANRRLGPWLVTLSYAATGVNAWMLMTVAAAAFLWGLSAAWIWAAVVFGCVVNMWFVAPRLRAASIGSGGVTVIHVLSADAGDRLQPLVVRSAVLIMMVTLLLQIAAILQFAGVMLADVGLSTTQCPGAVADRAHRDRVRGRPARGEHDRHDSIGRADRCRAVPAAARTDRHRRARGAADGLHDDRPGSDGLVRRQERRRRDRVRGRRRRPRPRDVRAAARAGALHGREGRGDAAHRALGRAGVDRDPARGRRVLRLVRARALLGPRASGAVARGDREPPAAAVARDADRRRTCGRSDLGDRQSVARDRERASRSI